MQKQQRRAVSADAGADRNVADVDCGELEGVEHASRPV
jgi:hypothetical protein